MVKIKFKDQEEDEGEKPMEKDFSKAFCGYTETRHADGHCPRRALDLFIGQNVDGMKPANDRRLNSTAPALRIFGS